MKFLSIFFSLDCELIIVVYTLYLRSESHVETMTNIYRKLVFQISKCWVRSIEFYWWYKSVLKSLYSNRNSNLSVRLWLFTLLKSFNELSNELATLWNSNFHIINVSEMTLFGIHCCHMQTNNNLNINWYEFKFLISGRLSNYKFLQLEYNFDGKDELKLRHPWNIWYFQFDVAII